MEHNEISILGVGTTPATRTKVSICDSTGTQNAKIEINDDGSNAKISIKGKEIEIVDNQTHFIIKHKGKTIKI